MSIIMNAKKGIFSSKRNNNSRSNNSKKSAKTLVLSVLLLIFVLSFALPVMAATFKDASGHWAESYITYWADKGVVNGYEDGTIKPDNPITRAELAKLVALAFNLPTAAKSKFSDVPENAWYGKYLDSCVAAKAINGYPDNTFRPDAHATRAEAVEIICNAAKLAKGNTGIERFNDAADIPSWSSGSWNTLIFNGIIDGNPDNMLTPNSSASRSEILKILYSAVVGIKGTDIVSGKTYTMTITIKDNQGKAVSDSTKFLTSNTKTLPVISTAVVAVKEELKKAWSSDAMRKIVIDGLSLYNKGVKSSWSAADKSAWQTYVNLFYNTINGQKDTKDLFSNPDNTLSKLKADLNYIVYFKDTQAGRDKFVYSIIIRVTQE